MPTAFTKLPIYPNAQAADLIRMLGVDFTRWPQAQLPAELMAEWRSVAAETIASAGLPPARRDAMMKQCEQHILSEKPIIRTPWGFLRGEEQSDHQEEIGLVKVYCYANGVHTNDVDRVSALALKHLYQELPGDESVEVDKSRDDSAVFEFSVEYSDDRSSSRTEVHAKSDLSEFLTVMLAGGTLEEAITYALTTNDQAPEPQDLSTARDAFEEIF